MLQSWEKMKLVYIAINKSVAILKREGFLGEKEKK